MSSRLRSASDRLPESSYLPPESCEICGVRSGLLGRLVATSGVQIVATHGMLNDRIENVVTTDQIVFGYTPRIPADTTIGMDGKTLGPIAPLSFIAPGASVTLRANSALTSSACTFSRSFLTELAQTERELRLDDIEFIRAFDSPNLAYLGRSMFNEAIRPGFANSVFAESTAMAIALEIARYVHNCRLDDGIRRGGLAPWQMRRLDSYVRDNLSGDLSLAELARLLAISPRHLSRVVKQAKGVSLHRWIAECRLEEARRLLSETNLPIQHIAQRAAFQSAASFSTAFRAASGFSPGEFRRLILGGDVRRE